MSVIPAAKVQIKFHVYSERALWIKSSTPPSYITFSETSLTEENYKQEQQRSSSRRPARLVSIKTKLQAQHCYDLLLTETVASGDRRAVRRDHLRSEKKTFSFKSISKTSRRKRAVGHTMTVHTQPMSHLKLNQSALVLPEIERAET